METPKDKPASPASQPTSLSGREQYNVVSDVVVGVNVRWRDNLIQAAFIALVTVIGVAVGWSIAEEDDKFRGASLGALAGLIAGTILSGAAIMIFRFVRHVRGRHD